ncbi:MAG: energy transducer TonB [Chitinophagaceae bacterium]|nr:energy transducer TonB [Chitinophagaceae bacterium]
MFKYILIFFILLVCSIKIEAQTSNTSAYTFINYQRTIPKITDLLKRKEDTLMKQFKAKNLEWPAKYIYIRSFKYDSQLEVWVKNDPAKAYKLFKTYKVCALAGTLGPKRMQGDYQVPEGFYRINEFNANSQYHLSLGLNYPNASDKALSDLQQPGGDIYIHGSCVTTGCIPVMDAQIEELYVLAAHARDQGQDFIPVHIFPINFNNSKSLDYLKRHLQTFSYYAPFANKLKSAFYYFEKNRQVPLVLVDGNGEYVVEEESAPIAGNKKPTKMIVKKKRLEVKLEDEIPPTVNQLPVYPGGPEAFQLFLKKLNVRLIPYLEEDQKTAYVMMEFTVTKEGKVVNPKIIRGGNDEMNEYVLDAFEEMSNWQPAIRQEKNVPIKLKQTIVVEAL